MGMVPVREEKGMEPDYGRLADSISEDGDIITGERSTCVYCGERIAAVVDSSSGCVDWAGMTGNGLRRDDKPNGDFGCEDSPDTDEDGTGGHNPGDDHTPLGFRIEVDSRTYWKQLDAIRAKVGADAFDRGARVPVELCDGSTIEADHVAGSDDGAIEAAYANRGETVFSQESGDVFEAPVIVMNAYKFTVTVEAESLDQARIVMAARIGHDEDLTDDGVGDYSIDWEDQLTASEIDERLEYLRGEIEAERISMGELIELQALADYIDPDDVQLLEWAGVPETGPGRELQAERHAVIVAGGTVEPLADGFWPDPERWPDPAPKPTIHESYIEVVHAMGRGELDDELSDIAAAVDHRRRQL